MVVVVLGAQEEAAYILGAPLIALALAVGALFVNGRENSALTKQARRAR